jgi:hypothetical protein
MLIDVNQWKSECQSMKNVIPPPILPINRRLVLWIYIYRRLGGESDREILMVPACVILSLGLWSWISPPGSGSVRLGPARPSPVARKKLLTVAGVLKNLTRLAWQGLGFCGLLRPLEQQCWGFKGHHLKTPANSSDYCWTRLKPQQIAAIIHGIKWVQHKPAQQRSASGRPASSVASCQQSNINQC